MKIKILISRFAKSKAEKLGLSSEMEHYENWLTEQYNCGNLKEEQKHRILSKEWHNDYRDVEPSSMVVKCRIFQRKTSVLIKVVKD